MQDAIEAKFARHDDQYGVPMKDELLVIEEEK